MRYHLKALYDELKSQLEPFDLRQAEFTVNGKAVSTSQGVVSYYFLVLCAGMKGKPSVTVAKKLGPSCTLSPGQTVVIEQGMVVNVCRTGNA